MSLVPVTIFGNPFTSAEVTFLQTFADLTHTQGDTFYINSSGQVSRLPAGTNGYVLTTGGAGANPSWTSVSGGSSLTVGTTTISSGTNTYIEYNNSGVLGEYAISGSGSVAMTISPTFTTPTLGAATATTINKVTITAPASSATLTIATGKTLTISNSLTLSGTDGTTMTFPSTSATVARTDAANTFTGHQTIEGVTSTGATGTGNLVFATAPTVTLASASTAVTQTAGDNTTAVATDAFVTTAIANAVAGNNPVASVSAATTGSANTSSWTYVHVAGIGDTFTGPTNTAIVIDGFTFNALTQTLLIKNDTQTAGSTVTAGTFNGVYNLTALQTAGTGAIFTRRLDYDTPTDINNSGVVPVINGTVNASTTWLQTNIIAAVGTGTGNNLSFTQFSYSPTAIIPPSLGGTGVANNGANTVTFSGSYALTLTLTNTTSLTLPTSGTLVNTSVTTLSSLVSVGTITTGGLGTGATIAGVTMSLGSDAVGDIYSATTSNVLSRIAAVATGQVLVSKGTTTLPAWSASATLANLINTSNAVTASSNAATVPVTSRLTTVTNSSAATLTITITTTGAVDGQLVMVRILDATGVAETITWVNTENSTVSAPTTSNGSTTLPLTVGFQFNTNTTKWRCIALA